MNRRPLADFPLVEDARRCGLWHAQHSVDVDSWQARVCGLVVRQRSLCDEIRLELDPETHFGPLTQSKIAGALANHQVVRLSCSGVLECQDRPITRRSAITQFVYLLACLCQRHCFLICISNQRNCVIIVFVETQRAWIAISA